MQRAETALHLRAVEYVLERARPHFERAEEGAFHNETVAGMAGVGL